MILRRDLQEASGGLIAAQLGPSSAPRRLNAGNHLSDLIRGGMKRAVLINADLDGRMERRMDGWMDGPPPLLHHQHQYHQRRPPPRRRRPAGILLHIHGVQSDNGCLSDRKLQD